MKKLITTLVALLSISAFAAEGKTELTEETYHYVSSEGRNVRGMSNFYANLKSQFGSAVPETITVKFMADEEENNPMARRFNSAKDQVMVLTIPGRDVAPCTIVGSSTLLAITHLYPGNKVPAEVKFLNYGFALVAEAETCPDLDLKLNPNKTRQIYWNAAKELLAKGPLTLAMLKTGTHDRVSPAFALWLSVTIPSEQLVALVKSTAAHGNTEEAFAEVLGKDSATVEKEWIEFLSK